MQQRLDSIDLFQSGENVVVAGRWLEVWCPNPDLDERGGQLVHSGVGNVELPAVLKNDTKRLKWLLSQPALEFCVIHERFLSGAKSLLPVHHSTTMANRQVGRILSSRSIVQLQEELGMIAHNRFEVWRADADYDVCLSHQVHSRMLYLESSLAVQDEVKG